ncbi:MAG: hypothetical protein ACRC7O_17590, partial [Fimbriiglobus sp.]
MPLPLRLLLPAAVLLAVAAPSAFGQYLSEIGFTALQTRLGAGNSPTGAGVVVGQVEATSDGAARPDPSLFPGVSFTDHTGGTPVSGHASGVGDYLYGSLSMATGVTHVHTYAVVGNGTSTDWLGGAFLNAGTMSAPLVSPARIVNSSYASTGSSPLGADILRRMDFAAVRDGTIFVNAVNNGSGTTVPPLPASGYNGISVGLSNGLSSLGPTTVETAGRSKPDIVVPLTFTSNATPV